jgi:HEAT repeat protein
LREKVTATTEREMKIISLVRRRQKFYLTRGQRSSAALVAEVASEAIAVGIVHAHELLAAIKAKRLSPTRLSRMIWLAATIMPRAVAPELVRILKTTRSRVLWFQAATGLCRPTELIEVLRSSQDSWKRRTAAYALTGVANNVAVRETLLHTARIDQNVRVRARAIESLAFGSKKAIPQLRHLLRDRNPTIRFWTCYALSQLGGENELNALAELRNDAACPAHAHMGRTVGQEARWAIREIKRRIPSGATEIGRSEL